MMQVMRESHHIHHGGGFDGGRYKKQAGAFRNKQEYLCFNTTTIPCF